MKMSRLTIVAAIIVGVSGATAQEPKKSGVDKLLDKVIDRVTPEADENCRELQRDTVKYVLDPNKQRSDERWKKIESDIQRDFGPSASGQGNGAAPYHAQEASPPPPGQRASGNWIAPTAPERRASGNWITGGSVTIVVGANQLWVDTGVDLKKGESVHLSATGGWSFETSGPLFGASGKPNSSNRAYMLPSANLSALIAKIGNAEAFVVGDATQCVAPNEGRLYLAMHDSEVNAYYDNRGSLLVELSRNSK